MLLTAGACVAGALSHRPALQQPDLSPEQQADSDQAYIEGTLKAVGFISHLVFQVMDDEYDDQFEPRMMAIVRGDQVIPTEGWR